MDPDVFRLRKGISGSLSRAAPPDRRRAAARLGRGYPEISRGRQRPGHARRRGKSSNGDRSEGSSASSAVRPTSTPPRTPRSKARAILKTLRRPTATCKAPKAGAGLTPAAIFISGSASTPWAALANGLAVHGGLFPTRRPSHFLGLYAPVDPARGVNGSAGGLRFHARQHRLGRGRPDPSARRAAGEPAGHPELARAAPRRRQRGRRRLAGGRETRDRPTALVLSRQNVPTLDRAVFRPGRGPSPRSLRAGRSDDRSAAAHF